MDSREFVFSRNAATGKLRSLQRFLEFVPATCSWLIIVGLLVLMFVEPVITALFIIAFVLSWLFRMVYSNTLLALSFYRLSAEEKTDWMGRLLRMERLEEYAEEVAREPRKATMKERTSQRNLLRDLRAALDGKEPPPEWHEVRHVVLIPVARETREIFEPGIVSIAQGTFPSEKVLVILAVEGRAPAETIADARAVQEAWGSRFMDLQVVLHPDGIPGEARVKGANSTFAAKAAAEFMRVRGIGYDRVVLSCFDADTVVSPQYFGCLTYHFLTCPNRNRAGFQPIPVYTNNFWEAPSFARILDISSSFYMLVEATNPEKLVTFSSHSMSFKALVDIGYWPVDMVSDDSAVYWKAFIHFDGDYRVVPMYVTLAMDLTQSETMAKTAVNLYKQRRRWAWGVEAFPLVVSAFLHSKKIPLFTRIKQAFRLFHAHITWATWPFMLTVMSWLPAMVISMGHSHSVVRYNEPRVLSTMFNLSMIGFLVYAVLSQVFLPRQKGGTPVWKRLLHALEWVLVPPVSLAFGAIPALDAQTRLLLGHRLGFWVTVKKRKEKKGAPKA